MQRYEALDLVRGLCALAVAVYHYMNWTAGVDVQSMGAFGVYIFFILSALTMMIAYARNFSDEIRFEALRSFYLNRCARILPLLCLVAVVMAAGKIYAGQPVAETIAEAFLTGTTLFGLHMAGFISNAVGAWSLGVEAVFYALFPIIAIISAQASLGRIVAASAFLIAGQQASILLISPKIGSDFWFYYVAPLTFAPFFALGIAIFKAPLPKSDINMFLSLASLICVLGFSLVFPADIYSHPLAYLMLTALSGLVVATAFQTTVPLAFRPIANYLGKISYALYLTHWFSYRLAELTVSKAGLDPMFQPVLFAVIAIAAAYATYKIFEVPTGRAIRSWGNSKRSLKSVATKVNI